MKNRKLRISCGINLDTSTPDDLRDYMVRGIDFNAKAGFDALDFNTAYVPRYAPENGLELMAEMKEYAAGKGLRFEVVHLPFGVTPYSSDEQLSRFAENMYKAIDAAAVLGPDIAVVHPIATTEVAYSADPTLNHKRDVAYLAPFVEYAGKKGVNIAVENMRLGVENYKHMPSYMPLTRNCHTPEELCRVADELGIGVCWDFGHAHICRLRHSECLEYIGKRLKITHVCDNFAYDDEHLPPYMGNIDWDDAALGLAKCGYNGLFNYEVKAASLPASAREIYAQYLITVGEKIVDCVAQYS